MAERDPMNMIFSIVILGSVAFLVASGLLPEALSQYYNGIDALANTNVSGTNTSIAPTYIIVILEVAPVGIAVALLLVFLQMAGLDLGTRLGGGRKK